MNTPKFPDKQQNLDQFIEKVEQLERKRRRHVGQISLVTLAVLGGISTLFWQMNGSENSKNQEFFRTFFASELNPEHVRTLFSENQQKIIVKYDGTSSADTIASVREYLSIFYPQSNAPVVEGSIVSSESTSDEWDYEEDGDQASPKPASPGNTQRNKSQRKREFVPAPMTPKNTNILQPPGNAGNNTLSSSASFDETGDFIEESDRFATNNFDEQPEDDFSELALASAESNNQENSLEEEQSGSVRARNLQALQSNQETEESTSKSQSSNNTPSSSGTKSINEPLEMADRMPSYPGGTVALQEFLDSRLTYPSEAREHEVEGKVYIRFVVNSDGSLSDFKLLRGIGFGCDEEAMRVAQSLPKWIPGRQGLTRVPVKYTLPIRFKLQ